MRTSRRSLSRIAASLLASGVVVAATSPASASSNYTIDWLTMNPVAFGNPVQNFTTGILPNVGGVTITHDIPLGWDHLRESQAYNANGSISFGGDTYSWGHHESMRVLNLIPSTPPVPTSWSVTYMFPSAQAAGTIVVGIAGLGRSTDWGGIATQATVLQNGTFLGDWMSGQGFAPSLFFGGAGSFTMINSTSGPGTSNPWWNTELGIVRIDDTVSSLTVYFSQYPGDGINVNIGVIPTPASLGVLGLGGLLAARRRR